MRVYIVLVHHQIPPTGTLYQHNETCDCLWVMGPVYMTKQEAKERCAEEQTKYPLAKCWVIGRNSKDR
jgi:hypothetical protein